MKITAANLIRWAGLSAMVAGLFYVIEGLFHPPNVLASVTTTRWAIVHVLEGAMTFFGLIGITGLYARQAEKSGWLGLVGYILFSLWLVFVTGFLFFEAFILPQLATEAPAFAEGFLGMFTGSASEVDLGVLPVLWMLTAPLYIFGGLLFGLATFRASILPRWAGALLAIGVVIAPVAVLFPPEHALKIAVLVGLALMWLGYATWAERRERASEAVLGRDELSIVTT
ncbi:MAG TPA: hypothetical protein VHP83_09520 [Aggregatilineaceae bacterium]|nr:hypothetical protein [Aggregatilineaceae bacterium]